MDIIQIPFTANSRHVNETIAASTRASQQAVDALSLRFETLSNSNVTQWRLSMVTDPAPVPATFHHFQVLPASHVDIEDALCEASLRPDVDAPSQSGKYRSNLGTTLLATHLSSLACVAMMLHLKQCIMVKVSTSRPPALRYAGSLSRTAKVLMAPIDPTIMSNCDHPKWSDCQHWAAQHWQLSFSLHSRPAPSTRSREDEGP